MKNTDDGREVPHAAFGDVKKVLTDLLRSRSKKARFMTEVYAAMRRLGAGGEETDRALAELESEGTVMMRDHFCADPHLAGVDLRIVAIVDGSADENPQLSAIHEIDNAWDKWLADYLSNHRCG
jgi:hypothetical protein